MNFRFIKETNKVEISSNGQLLILEADESDHFLFDLILQNQVKDNVINRKERAFWQRSTCIKK